MFEIQSNSQGTYRTIARGVKPDDAISLFNDAVEQRRPSESVRLVGDEGLWARKTPKGHFIHPEWEQRLTRI